MSSVFTMTSMSTMTDSPALEPKNRPVRMAPTAAISPSSPTDAPADAPALDAIDQAIVAFQNAYVAVVGQADALLAERGLGRSHHKILFYVARHPRCSVADVRDFIGVTRQALQRPLNDLHRLGHVETLVSPQNRRIHLLRLTDAGERYEAAVSALVRVHFETAFTAVGAGAQSQWNHTMEALAASAAAENPDGSVSMTGDGSNKISTARVIPAA